MDQLSGSIPTGVAGLFIHHTLDFSTLCGRRKRLTKYSELLRESGFVLELMNECRNMVTPTYTGHLLMEFLEVY
jgi:hypothetical protein